MQKLDLKKEEKPLYSARKDRATLVDVPDEPFLMVDGKGSPNDPAFQDAIRALYAVAYALKFDAKGKDAARDFVVMPLEAVWSWEGEGDFATAPERAWQWTLMIQQPPFVDAGDVASVIEKLRADGNAGVERVRLERYGEGRAMQIMHVGPYKDEYATIQRLHEEMRKQGYAPAGKHHEIYMGDPRRSKPENLKTILRQPVK